LQNPVARFRRMNQKSWGVSNAQFHRSAVIVLPSSLRGQKPDWQDHHGRIMTEHSSSDADGDSEMPRATDNRPLTTDH
jgi:hypothetical protein